MRAVLQRVSKAGVRVDGKLVTAIGRGLLVLLAAGDGDKDKDADWMSEKIAHLRIFDDEQGRMNCSLVDVGGEMIVVSQFTLFGDCYKGRRPSFVHALNPEMAKQLIARFVEAIRKLGITCGTGVFGAHMEVELTNDGPVTLLIDSALSRRAYTYPKRHI